MPQYLLSVHHTTGRSPEPPEDLEVLFAAVEAFNNELQEKGHWVFAGGLEGPEVVTVVDARSDRPVVADAPYADGMEYLGGFWVVEAADLDEALALAQQGSRACREVLHVRPFQGA